MNRMMTAIYRTDEVADLVRQELEQIGIERRHIWVLPETSVVPDTASPTRSTRITQEDLAATLDRLHDLHLPERDTKVYQQAIRSGDHVVSVALDDGADLERIGNIMRRPEAAYDLDVLDDRYGSAEYVPRRRPLGDGHDAGLVGQRDLTASSPYTRHYRRELPDVPPRSSS